MHKNKVRIFRQNQTMETCLCCCILMVLDYYRKLPNGQLYPTKQMENNLYRYIGYHLDHTSIDIRFRKGTPLSAAAYEFIKAKLDVTMYHSELDFMCNRYEGQPYYPEEIFPEILEKYRYWMNLGKEKIVQKQCKKLTGELIKKLLQEEKLIVTACIVDSEIGRMLHAVVIDSYSEENGTVLFHVCDPANGKYFIEAEELINCMNTPVGIQFMTIQ